MDLENLQSGFNEMLTFGSTFVGSIGNSIGSIASAVLHPIDTYNHVVDQTAGVMARTMEAGAGNLTSLFIGEQYLIGNVTGLTGIAEGLYGQDFSTGQNLSSEERWTRGLGGVGNLALLGAGGVGALADSSVPEVGLLRDVSSANPNVLDLTATGRLGGELYGDAQLAKLEGYLARRDVTLVKNADAFLTGQRAGAAFQAFPEGTANLYVRSNATSYDVWHELVHYRDFTRLGYDEYAAWGRAAREQKRVRGAQGRQTLEHAQCG